MSIIKSVLMSLLTAVLVAGCAAADPARTASKLIEGWLERGS